MLRIFVFILVLALFGSSTQAQTVDPCFGLPADQCQVIGQASEHTFSIVRSFNLEFSLQFALAGLEPLGLGQDVALQVNGTGTAILSEESFFAPQSLQLDMTGSLTTTDATSEGTLGLRLLDNQVFLQVNQNEWQAINLETVLASQSLSALNLSQVALPFSGGSTDLNATDFLESLAAFVNTPGFIRYEQLSPDTSSGQARLPFSFTMDFSPLFASSPFQQQLDEALTFAGQLDPNLENIALLAPVLLESSELSINLTQQVNTEQNFIDRLAINAMGTLDLNPILGTTEANRTEPITLNFDFTVSLSDVNQALTITAPAAYTEVTLDQLGLE